MSPKKSIEISFVTPGSRGFSVFAQLCISSCLCFKQTIPVKCVALVLYCFFVCWPSNQESWLEDQDSGFRNRAIKNSLKTRQLILGYIGSTKMHKTIGTPPCTLRQPWVTVFSTLPHLRGRALALWRLNRAWLGMSKFGYLNKKQGHFKLIMLWLFIYLLIYYVWALVDMR